MLERYLIPLAPYVLLAATSIVGLLYIACLEKELSSLKSRLRKPREVESALNLSLKAKLEDLTARLQDAEDRAGIVIPPAPPRASLNLNKRTQVIRMSRRGEPAENIAASLSIPRREVDLLIKVYGLVLNGNNDNPS